MHLNIREHHFPGHWRLDSMPPTHPVPCGPAGRSGRGLEEHLARTSTSMPTSFQNPGLE